MMRSFINLLSIALHVLPDPLVCFPSKLSARCAFRYLIKSRKNPSMPVWLWAPTFMEMAKELVSLDKGKAFLQKR